MTDNSPMRYRVDLLEGVLLDAAVALVDRVLVTDPRDQTNAWDEPSIYWYRYVDGDLQRPRGGVEPLSARYSNMGESWAAGGPLIAKALIGLCPNYENDGETWVANCGGAEVIASTPLLAAMRAYVAEAFGEEIELPLLVAKRARP